MAKNKTKAIPDSVDTFLERIEHPTRKANAMELDKLFRSVTGLEPQLWSGNMVGYGTYHYKYESGREGSFFMTGFSPRKTNLSLYIMPGYEDMGDRLERLGKHKLGKSCLYINKLADVDVSVLEGIVRDGFEVMVERYGSSS